MMKKKQEMTYSKIWHKRYHKIGFLGLPTEVIITLGKGIERSSLAAFDKAELNAHIPDINAMTVTSFIPPGTTLITPDSSSQYLQEHLIVPGSLVPTALKYCVATRNRQQKYEVKADKIFAAIAVLTPEDMDAFPSIMMEYAGPSEPWEPATRDAVERYSTEMCIQIAELRREYGFRPQGDPKVWIVEEELPEDGSWACVLAAAVYVKDSLL